MATVTVRSTGVAQYAVETAYGGFAAHEAPPAGDGEAPDPHSLLLSALGTWTAATLRLYAERKGWELGEVTVEVSMEHDAIKGTSGSVVRKVVHVTGDLDDEQRERLHRIGDRCPVQRMLEGGLRVDSALDAG